MMKVCLRTYGMVLAMSLLLIPVAEAQTNWPERTSFDGDFRLRYESIDAEGSPYRDRSRLRARLGIDVLAAEDIKFVFRLATGDGSPVSTNLTLDGGFSAKDILVDRAYVDWRLSEQWTLHGGKIKSPWFRAGGSSLIWDADLNPEGVAAHFRSGSFFASLAALPVEERSSADDSLLLTAQGGWKIALAENASLTTGLGYYSYTNAAGSAPFYDGHAAGNSVDLAGNYLNDYRLIEAYAEYKTVVGEIPLTAYLDVVRNNAVSVEDTGYAIGANLGSANAPGKAEFGYAWQDTEADAVVGTYNDSDFAGGVTDARGHFIKAKYAIRDNVKLGGTLILARRGAFAGNERDYD
ncbi:MAG: putative porin, partial [Halioglobus sp.]|nr:putative porin [Halioglobus sp.]